jgi:hypothetical protein
MEGYDDEMPRFAKRPENHDLKKVKRVHYSNDLRSEVVKYLGDKLAKKLNISSIKLPWSRMKAEDIINWPSDVEFKTINRVGMEELKRLHELVKIDKLDFTPEFLSRLQTMSQLSVAKLRSNFAKYLQDKLAKKLNVPSIKVPWSKMKAADIINWPLDVEFLSPGQMNFNDLTKLHGLAVEDKLDFCPEVFKRTRAKLSKSKLFLYNRK